MSDVWGRSASSPRSPKSASAIQPRSRSRSSSGSSRPPRVRALWSSTSSPARARRSSPQRSSAGAGSAATPARSRCTPRKRLLAAKARPFTIARVGDVAAVRWIQRRRSPTRSTRPLRQARRRPRSRRLRRSAARRAPRPRTNAQRLMDRSRRLLVDRNPRDLRPVHDLEPRVPRDAANVLAHSVSTSRMTLQTTSPFGWSTSSAASRAATSPRPESKRQRELTKQVNGAPGEMCSTGIAGFARLDAPVRGVEVLLLRRTSALKKVISDVDADLRRCRARSRRSRRRRTQPASRGYR